MFVKLAVSACVLAVAFAGYNGPLAGGQPAAQYPAGVDPQACPNYPDCENPAVAVNQQPIQQQYRAAPQQYHAAPQQYNPAPVPQYNPAPAPQYNQAPVAKYAPAVQNALDRGEYIGDGDYHGEGLAEAGAPGYQGQAQAYNPAPAAYNPAPAAYNPAPAAYNPAPAPYNPHHQLPAGAAQAPQIPAGVDARSCPNYPFCA